MKVENMTALAGIGGAMILNGSADAVYIGLRSVRVAQNQATAAGPRDVFRVYAAFTDPNDRVNAWYGIAFSPMTIQNILADGVTLGSGFTQFGGAGGQIAPYSPGTTRDWDTYATIGVRYGSQALGGQDATALSPGAPVFINGNSLVNNNFAVFVTPDDPQGLAGYAAADGGPANCVMLMQLTVAVGQHIRVNINLDGAYAGGGSGFTFLNQTLFPPAPGALALLGVAGLHGRRRRTA